LAAILSSISLASRGDSQIMQHHVGGIIWLTGLSGAGKTTLAEGVCAALQTDGYLTCVLDGDALRTGLNADLGFSIADRAENARRVGAVAQLFADNGFICLVALVSPSARVRDALKARSTSAFHEVYVSAPLSICEQRDPKGLYAKARKGLIPEFTGVSAPYEPPASPALVVETGTQCVQASVAVLADYVRAAFPICV
jgi:adenylyl-sulfate kinase